PSLYTLSLHDALPIWKTDIWNALQEHLIMSATSILLAILIAVPLGILLTRFRKLAEWVIGIAAVIQTVPGLALLAFMVSLVGIGDRKSTRLNSSHVKI